MNPFDHSIWNAWPILVSYGLAVIALGLCVMRPTRRLGRWLAIFSLISDATLVLFATGLMAAFGSWNQSWQTWMFTFFPFVISIAAIVVAELLTRKNKIR